MYRIASDSAKVFEPFQHFEEHGPTWGYLCGSPGGFQADRPILPAAGDMCIWMILRANYERLVRKKIRSR